MKISMLEKLIFNLKRPIKFISSKGHRITMINLDAEDAVREWERINNNGEEILPKKVRRTAINIAGININEQRGITRDDIHFKSTKHDKRAVIYRLYSRKITVPLPYRKGRLSQYVLSNLYNEFISTKSNSDDSDNNHQLDYGLLDRVAEFFSKENPGMHNIHIETKMAEGNYETLGKWTVNDYNRSKTKEFIIGYRRRATVIAYPNGSTFITISCNSQSFKLHNCNELIEFFSVLGEIRRAISTEIDNFIWGIPPVNEWWLTQYDFDSTVSNDVLEREFPQINVSSSLRKHIPIKLFGYLFYFYLKSMPGLGQSSRFEERVFPKKKPLKDGIEEIIKSPPPFEKALDSLKETEEKSSDN
jgi:hypothetical protein